MISAWKVGCKSCWCILKLYPFSLQGKNQCLDRAVVVFRQKQSVRLYSTILFLHFSNFLSSCIVGSGVLFTHGLLIHRSYVMELLVHHRFVRFVLWRKMDWWSDFSQICIAKFNLCYHRLFLEYYVGLAWSRWTVSKISFQCSTFSEWGLNLNMEASK